ncbi:MAG: CSLREA domain-containing protein, partial [Anaerolineales bacterium]
MSIVTLRKKNFFKLSVRLMVLFLLTSIAFAAVRAVQAEATIVVNSFADRIANDGECTLREAVRAANEDKGGSKEGECLAGSGADTIVLPPGVYVLDRSDSGNEDAAAAGDLDVVSEITIVAEGQGASVVEAAPDF